MIRGQLARYITYDTNPTNDIALEQTGKTPAIMVVSMMPKPEPLIGAYAERVAQERANLQGVMIRDYIERLIFADQWKWAHDAEELE